MSQFKFNGDWEYQIEIPSFKGFQSRNGAYTSKDKDSDSDGIIRLEIEDDLTENPDPYPEQLKTINFILQHHDKIKEKIIDKTIEELPEIIKNYGLEDEEQFKNISKESVIKLFGISSITILIPSKNGSSYFDVSGGCDWDEEHGLNFLMHEERVLTFGGIEGNSYWTAIKDNGTYEEIKNKKHEKRIPKKYIPHSKYNKIKPSQKFANETFEHSLISGGFNKEFMRLVEEGEININGKWESQNKTFLEASCWFNNNELVEFLLKKGANIRYSIHQCVGLNSNPEALKMILQNGGDINQQDLGGKTILFIKSQELAKYYDFKAQRRKYNNGNLEEYDEKIEKLKEEIKQLINKGCNPSIKNSYGFDVYSTARNLPTDFKKEMVTFIESCNGDNVKEDTDDKNKNKPKWKFWK